jgi:hypothetical protein
VLGSASVRAVAKTRHGTSVGWAHRLPLLPVEARSGPGGPPPPTRRLHPVPVFFCCYPDLARPPGGTECAAASPSGGGRTRVGWR